MNKPQYLAQVGHSLGGCLAVVCAAFFWGLPAVWIALAVGVPLAALKEFWYDLRYERPKQTWSDSAMDFGFYLLGAAVGVGLALLKLRVLR